VSADSRRAAAGVRAAKSRVFAASALARTVLNAEATMSRTPASEFAAALGVSFIPERSFRRFAGIAALVSIVPAFASLLVALPAVDWNFDTLADMMLFLKSGERGAALGRWAMVFDLFGYYLMIAPAVIYVGRGLRARSPLWARLFTSSLLAYVLVGAIGAAVLAAALPALMIAHVHAAPAERATIEIVYRAVTDAVYGGLWNLLEEILAGVGWLGFGWMERTRRPWLGHLTIVLGLACLIDGLANAVGAKAIADAGLYAYLVLAPVWAAWVGVNLLREREG
jgi:hypothetical protein